MSAARSRKRAFCDAWRGKLSKCHFPGRSFCTYIESRVHIAKGGLEKFGFAVEVGLGRVCASEAIAASAKVIW